MMTGNHSRSTHTVVTNMAVGAVWMMLSTLTAADAAVDVTIEDFSSPRLTWVSKNDPVMGGESTGSVTVSDGLGRFDGEVVDVPFLKAPGFIQMETQGGVYPDVSSCAGIEFRARSNADYAGYRFSFGSAQAPGSRYARGFHAPFRLAGDDFASVKIPFTDFSDNWDGATGEIKVECADDPAFCPTPAVLRNLGTMAFWGEGVLGVVDLDVKTVGAYDCTDDTTPTTTTTTTPVQTTPTLSNDVLLIEDFSAKKMMWYAKNDPVMGGKSTSTVMVEDDLGKFSGEVVDVPFLSAPGFVTMESMGGPYPDVHCCQGIDFTARAMTDYAGYRLSFGMGHAEGGRYAFGFKAPFQVGQEFGSVRIPFTDFSDNWDDATGDIKVTCAADKKFCPDVNTLRDLGTMAFWGEGVDGVIDLEVKTVSAYGCTGTCGGYSNRNGGGNYGGGNYQGNNNNGGNYGGGNNNGMRGMDKPSVVQGSASEDIQNTIAVPLAVTAILASLVSLFCVFQTRNTVKSTAPVLIADTAAEIA